MKRTILIVLGFLATSTILFAQQQYRREHIICPIDGGRMDWTGQQRGGLYDASCEFAHDAVVDGKVVKHKAWASCTETR